MDYSLSIGIDEYHNFNPTPYAENDAREFNAVMEKVFSVESSNLILGNRVTYTTVKSEIEKIASKLDEEDRFIFFYAGHGVNINGIPHICMLDSNRDFENTWHDVTEFMKLISDSGCQKIIFFLDACESTINYTARKLGVTKFSWDERKELLENSNYCTVFSSTSHKGVADVMIDQKHGIWSYYLLKALCGEDKLALDDENCLTNFTLKNYLHHTVKKHCKKDSTLDMQYTATWGKEEAEFLIRRFPEKQVVKYEKIPPAKIKDVQFVSITFKSIKKLSGFGKSHTVPKFKNNNTNSFVQKCANDEIESVIEDVTKSLREEFNLKRKEYRVAKDTGFGEFTCPYFEYSFRVELSDDDYSQAKFISELRLFDINKILESNLDNCFPEWFDSLLFSLNKKIDLEKLVDNIEEADNFTQLYDYEFDTDLTYVELIHKQTRRTVMIREYEIEIGFKAMESVEEMLDGLKETANNLMIVSPNYMFLGTG
ncbi:caspase family protein [Cohnella endophytica]|uniref:Caspase family protein n=1 Tax=Cohnella endophytica TaxID=2419778 RepID=A0A494X820_9BACL|nr:caspase family protein [Cohnella endophytica]RKP44486.1 caspase family protein [Cohnella endophytica]